MHKTFLTVCDQINCAESLDGCIHGKYDQDRNSMPLLHTRSITPDPQPLTTSCGNSRNPVILIIVTVRRNSRFSPRRGMPILGALAHLLSGNNRGLCISQQSRLAVLKRRCRLTAGNGQCVPLITPLPVTFREYRRN